MNFVIFLLLLKKSCVIFALRTEKYEEISIGQY